MSSAFKPLSAQLSTVVSDEKLAALCAEASKNKRILDFLREALIRGGSPDLAARARLAGLAELAGKLECFANTEELLAPYVAEFGAATIDSVVRRGVGALAREVHAEIGAGVFKLELDEKFGRFGLVLVVPRRFGEARGAAGPVVALLSRVDAEGPWAPVDYSPLAFEPEKARALYAAVSTLVQDPSFVALACKKMTERLDATGVSGSWFTVINADNTLRGLFKAMVHLQPKAGIAVYQLALDVDEEPALAEEIAEIVENMLKDGSSYITIERDVSAPKREESDEREESASKRMKP